MSTPMITLKHLRIMLRILRWRVPQMLLLQRLRWKELASQQLRRASAILKMSVPKAMIYVGTHGVVPFVPSADMDFVLAAWSAAMQTFALPAGKPTRFKRK